MSRRDDLYAEFERLQVEYVEKLRSLRDISIGFVAHKRNFGALPVNANGILTTLKREIAEMTVRILRLRADYIEEQLKDPFANVEVPGFLPEEL